MTTLEIIINELQRQSDASHGNGLGCFSAADPADALIDGRVDLVALAAAIGGKRKAYSDGQIDAAATAAAEKANGGRFKDPLFYAPEHRAFWREVVKAALEAAERVT